MSTTAKKNPGFGSVLAAAKQAQRAVMETHTEHPHAPAAAEKKTGEGTKGVSLRLPFDLYRRVSQLSFDRRLARGAAKLKRDDADPDSIHGLILTALEEFLEREAPEAKSRR